MATYLDEGMDIVSAMPGEVQRAMALIRDLDSVSLGGEQTMPARPWQTLKRAPMTRDSSLASFRVCY